MAAMKQNSRIKHRTDNAPGKAGVISLYCFEAGPPSALIGGMVKSRVVLKLGRKGRLLVPDGTLSLDVDPVLRVHGYLSRIFPATSTVVGHLLNPQLRARQAYHLFNEIER